MFTENYGISASYALDSRGYLANLTPCSTSCSTDCSTSGCAAAGGWGRKRGDSALAEGPGGRAGGRGLWADECGEPADEGVGRGGGCGEPADGRGGRGGGGRDGGCRGEPSSLPAPAQRRTHSPSIRHLTRRGAVWYFRKRVPERFRILGVRAVCCLSLRTTSLAEAAARSLQLLPALETAWGWVDMNMMSERPLPVSAIEQVVNEVLIRELARIIHEAEGSLARTREEAQAVLERIERAKSELKEDAARRDYARAKAPAA